MIREKCPGCGHKLRTILDLGETPLANYYPEPGEPDGPSYPLRLAVCGVCWLVQQECVPDPAEIFGASYGFRTSSPASAAAAEEAAAWAAARSGKGLAIDAGCNDGELLAALARRGRVLGIEPSGAADAARERGLDVVAEPLTRESGAKIAVEHGKASLVTAFHVAAHVPDPADFLAGVAELLDARGVCVAEFQSLADLLTGGIWDLVYHEHRFFFSLATFSMLAGMSGLRVVAVEHTPAQAGSLRVVLRKTDLPSWRARAAEESESWLRSADAYAGLQARVNYSRDAVLRAVEHEHAEGRIIAGYAASAKSCTLLNFCGLDRTDLPWVTDTTPGKQGRETPGSRIPIRPDDMTQRNPDTWLLLAQNHLPVILRNLEPAWRKAGGRVVVPLPLPVVI